MAREMKLAKELQPEQLDVLNKATAPNPNEFIFVQGVAGSGKTTIALNIALKEGELNITRPADSRQTILFLTYNDRLAEYCRNTLANQPSITQMLAPQKNELCDGCINVMTVSDLFRLAVRLEVKGKFLSDEECINYMARSAAQRGILDLLPSQIFALITTFLRGRPELSDKSIDELNEIIERELPRSIHYRMYGDSLQDIRRRLLGTYEDWKRNIKGIDRADVAKTIWDQLQELEGHLGKLPELEAEYLRKISRHKLGDGDPKLYKTLTWLDQAFDGIQDIPKYEKETREDRLILAGKTVKQAELDEICTVVYNSIRDVGLRATPVWETICSHLRNPLIIVDEIQDLSQIECENLISLWLQMSRTHESHLILLGDLNQQITPSGFEWPTLHELVKEKCTIYRHPTEKPDFHDLSNNYRTTEEIASFVYSMMKSVVPRALPDQEIANRFLRYSIDPKATLPIELQNKINQIKAEGGDLVPHVLVGSNELFKKGVDKYVHALQAQENSSELAEKLLSTVIITEHGSQVDDLISKEMSKYVLDNDLIEVIPVLSCKGLEFDRCVLHGLSTKDLGKIEQDLISRWYTSFTRAKLQLLIYLTEREFEFITQLGWDQIPADVVLVKVVTSSDDIARELEQLGKTDLDPEARYHIAEAALSRFLLTGNEDHLQKSLRQLRQAELNDRFGQVAWQGAEWFEKQSNFLKAADYYHEAISPEDEVRCLALHANQLSMDRVAKSEIKAYLDRAVEITKNAPDFENQAKCWLLLQEYGKALESAKQSEDTTLQQEIASKVADAIMLMARGEPENATVYAELLEESGYRNAAALSWLSLSKWDKAFDCASGLEKKDRDLVFQNATELARGLAKKPNSDAGVIAEKLYQNKCYEESAEIWLLIRNIPAAVRSLVSAGDVEKAEKLVKAPENKTDSEQKKLIYSILARGFRRETRNWHRAYGYFYLADMKDECQHLDQECRVLEDYLTLANCYSEAGNLKKIVTLANELELKGVDRKELIAECWQKAGEWERSANAWMKMFYEHIERSDELLGPCPDRNDPHPSSKKRFNQNIEKNLTNYQLLLTDWENLSKYTSSPKQFFENTAKVVEMISRSDSWQQEANNFFKSLRERARNASVGLTDASVRVRLPEKIKPLTTGDVSEYWERITTANDIFQKRAVELSRGCYKKGDKLLAIRLMSSVCTWRDEAMKMSEDLKETNPELWIKSWKMLEYSSESIEKKIFLGLQLTSQPDLIRQAIFQTYQDVETRRNMLWEKYRNKLISINSKKAQEILRKHFPEYNPPQPEQELPPAQVKVTDLIKDIAKGIDNWALHEGDRIELCGQLDSMREILTQPDRLSAKWKMAKSLIPEALDDKSRVKVERLDKLIQEVQPAVELERPVENPVIAGDEIDSDEKHHDKARHRHKGQNHSRGTLQKVDLHGLSLEDAQQVFEDKFQTYSRDRSVGALLVIHGYGKNKDKSVIKEWMEQRIKRLKGSKRVRRIIKGEEIADPFDKNAQILQEAVDELDFSEIGVNSPAYTAIVFRRS